jgi:probable HAF family extracellular repeat protein
VVGSSSPSADTYDGPYHAFLYSGGQMSDLGTLGGPSSFAYGINEADKVVGEAYTSGDTHKGHAFLYDANATPKMKDLGTLGGPYSAAEAINDSDQVVGYSTTNDTLAPSWHAFLYSDGVMRDLGTLGGPLSFAYGINNTAKVVGQAYTGGDNQQGHAFLYSGGQMSDLGTLGGSWSVAYSINDSDKVVGHSATSGDAEWHAFLYEASATPRMQDLGTLGGSYSAAEAINDSDQVVGYSTTSDNADQHAFLYSGGVMRDLNSLIPANSGWILTSAHAINDNGNIVGVGIKDVNGESGFRAFVLEPDNTAPAVYSTSPSDEARGVSRATSVTATFVEENMDATTLNNTTFQLFSGNSKNPVKATVGPYDEATKTVTLIPSSKLDAKVTYTVKIKGGESGVKDLAGNALASDYTWTFTTGSR